MCCFQEKKKTFILCLYQQMFTHFKLHKGTFSYFVRWFCFLILPFDQNRTPKPDPQI